MRDILLDDSPAPKARPNEQGHISQISRRRFLQAVGLAGVAVALSPSVSLAQASDFARWRDHVTGFVYTVCSDSQAQAISSQLSAARLEWAPKTKDFHYYYAAPLIFVGTTISPQKVICGNGFAVDKLPFYDATCPCNSISDLNAHEIRRITNAKEIEYYGCVMVPISRRIPLEYADHVSYRRTASNYGLDPDLYTPVYKRVFKGKGRTAYGFRINEKKPSGANGKTLGDMLLSLEDI